MGQAFLWHLRGWLHCLSGLPADAEGSDFCHAAMAELAEEAWLDLAWWQKALKLGLCQHLQSTSQSALGTCCLGRWKRRGLAEQAAQMAAQG